MRKEHYSLVLEVPGKDGDVEVKHYRVISDQASMAKTRADVQGGQLVILEGAQWVLLSDRSVLGEDIVERVLYTSRLPRQEQLTGEYEYNVAKLYNSSPYAQALIKALYFFGEFSEPAKRVLLKDAQERWRTTSREREHKSALENVQHMISRGEITPKDLRSIAACVDRDHRAYEYAKTSKALAGDDEDCAKDETFALKA